MSTYQTVQYISGPMYARNRMFVKQVVIIIVLSLMYCVVTIKNVSELWFLVCTSKHVEKLGAGQKYKSKI